MSNVTTIPLRQCRTVGELLSNDQFKNSLKAVAAKNMTPERILKLVAKAISRTPKLSECDPMSMYRAVMTSVELGLEFNSPLGHAFILPYYDGRNKRYEAQFIPGYKGFLALAYRHPSVMSVHADVVYDDDLEWRFSYGSHRQLHHIPGPRQGNVMGAYCYAALRDGGEAYRFLTAAEIIAVRDGSSGWKDAVKKGKTGNSPWSTHEPAMMRKTAVRALANSGEMPMSAEFADAIDADYDIAPIDLGATIDGAISGGSEDIIEAEPAAIEQRQDQTVPAETGREAIAETVTARVQARAGAAAPTEQHPQGAAATDKLTSAQERARAAVAAKRAERETAAQEEPTQGEAATAEEEDARAKYQGWADRIRVDVDDLGADAFADWANEMAEMEQNAPELAAELRAYAEA